MSSRNDRDQSCIQYNAERGSAFGGKGLHMPLCLLRQFGNSWHMLECIKSECLQCGSKFLKLCSKELDPTNANLMSWCCFEKVQAGLTKEGEPKQVIRLQVKQSIPRVF